MNLASEQLISEYHHTDEVNRGNPGILPHQKSLDIWQYFFRIKEKLLSPLPPYFKKQNKKKYVILLHIQICTYTLEFIKS